MSAEPAARLRMETERRIGLSNRARLNPELLVALKAEGASCEVCRDISKDVESIPGGGEFVETPGFPGATVQKLNAHFKFHWKDGYEFVDLSGRRG